MNARRALALALAVAAVCAMTVGSMGFSSVSASRDVAVSVVDSEDAYVGVQACERANSNANGQNANRTGHPARVTVTNRYVAAITVVEITDEDGPEDVERDVGVGEAESFDGVRAREGDTVTVRVSGDGVDATVDATVEAKGACT